MPVLEKAKQQVLGGIIGAALGLVAIVGAGRLVFVTKAEMTEECKEIRMEFRGEVAKLRLELRGDMKEDHKETMAGLSRIEQRIDRILNGGS
jgi:hypothetical protein